MKLNWLKQKLKKRTAMNIETQRRQELQDLRDFWLEETVGKGKNADVLDNNIPVYGNVKLDSDEVACLSLGPKFNNFPVLSLEDIKLEGVLTHTKARWGRATTGGPKDQEEDEREFGEPDEPTDEEIFEEHRDRLTYNPETKVIDFRNLKVTDIKDCPRLQLPAPRNQEEELDFKAKETLWSIKYKNFMNVNCDDKGRICEDNMTRQE